MNNNEIIEKLDEIDKAVLMNMDIHARSLIYDLKKGNGEYS